MNNVDIAIQQLRQLQSDIFSPRSSQQSLFEQTEAIIQQMQKASIEINQNYEEISKKLTAQLNTGKPQ